MKITNKHGLPDPLYRTICWAIEKYEGPKAKAVLNDHRVSVTTLINPPRLTLLRAYHEESLEVDASSLLWMVQGIAFHYMMSEIGWSDGEDPLIEQRIERSHKGWTITGQFDVFARSTLADWKWTSIWSIATPKFEWDAQLNLYRWLGLSRDLDPSKLETWALLRDWSEHKAAKDKRLPPIPFARVERAIWSDEELNSYLDTRVDLYEKAVQMTKVSGSPNTVPVCTAEERWERKGMPARCTSYCDVAQFCTYGNAFNQK